MSSRKVRPKTAGPSMTRPTSSGRGFGSATSRPSTSRPTTALRRSTAGRPRPSTAAANLPQAPTVEELANELKLSRAGKRPASHRNRPSTALSASSRIRRRPKTAMETFRKKQPFAHPDAWVDGSGTDSSSADERFLAPTSQTFKKLATNDAHFHQRQLSLKALRDVDKGSRAASARMRKNQETLRSIGTYAPSATAGSKATTEFPLVDTADTAGERQTRLRKALSETKQRGRTALFAYTMDQRMEIATEECEREAAGKIRGLQFELQGLQRDINLDGYSKRELQRGIVEDTLIEEDYKHTIEMLRRKMQKMSEREMSMEEELMNYRQFEPIFKDLSEKYDFESPEDVIRKLQNLEMDQMDKYGSLLEMKEAKEKTSKMLDEFSSKRDALKMDQLGDLHAAKIKIEKIVNDLDRQLEDVRASLEKARGTKNKSLELQQAVRELYGYWSDKAERIGEYLDPPPMDQPLAIIQRFGNLFKDHPPYKVGHVTHTLHALGNSLWSQFFSDHPDMKCRPVLIYRAVADLLASKKDHRDIMKKKVAQAQLENKRLTRLHDNKRREARRLALDVSKWKTKWHKEFEKFENEESAKEFEAQMKSQRLGRHGRQRVASAANTVATVLSVTNALKSKSSFGTLGHGIMSSAPMDGGASEGGSAADSGRDILSLHRDEAPSTQADSHIRKYLE